MTGALASKLSPLALTELGRCRVSQSDDGMDGTVVLIGPDEPEFWPLFKQSAEYNDGLADPIDRWSRRVISELASGIGGTAHFPFGEPLHPFMGWAIRSGRAWSSPVRLLVHDTAGMMVSYRGAILIPERLDLTATGPSPCETCQDRPCLSACPVEALTANLYDLDACHAFLDTENGAECMQKGCAVRRSCPISVTYGRMAAQSAFHMERFHR